MILGKDGDSARSWPAMEGKGNNRFAALAISMLEFFEHAGFEVVGVGDHFAGGYVFGRCSAITEFADAESLFVADWRPEDAAGHRTRGVQIAGAGDGIEHRTDFIVGKGLKTPERFGCVVKNAGERIAGKVRCESCFGVRYSLLYAIRSIRILRRKLCQASAEPSRVQLIDGEDSNATLIAARLACEPWATARGCRLKRGIYDLNQLRIGSR